MSDSLNALLQHVDGVPTVPSGGTTLVNPLAAVRAGNEAAQQVFQTRGLQAQQAIGQILQQSTDASGNVDYQMAHRLAASAGPVVQMGMMSMAKDASGLRGSQIAQAGALNGLLAMHGMSLMKDPSDTNTNAVFDNLAANGMPADVVARERARVLAMSPADRQNHAYQEGLAHLDQVRQVLGQTTPQNVGPRIVATTLNQPTPGQPRGSVVEGGGGVGLGMNPAEYAQHQQWLLGEVEYPNPADPTKTKKATRATMFQDLHVDPRQVWPGALQGAAPPPAAASGGAPSVTPPAAPRGTTTRSSFPPPPPGVVEPAAPPTTSPAPFGTGTGASTPTAGTVKEVEGSVQHATDARARTLTYQRDIQPIEGAITALSGADTGRASEALNSLRANIQDIAPAFLQRMLPTSLTDPKARQAFEEANKYLTAMQLAAPGGSRSDAGAATAGAANPNVHISNAAAREVALAILAQRRMEHAGTILFNQSGKPGGDFDKHMGEWNTAADPRAFVVDKMTPGERQAYVKGLGGTDTPAYQQYKKSYMDAVTSGVSPPPR